jgi:hypothetical protein
VVKGIYGKALPVDYKTIFTDDDRTITTFNTHIFDTQNKK